MEFLLEVLFELFGEVILQLGFEFLARFGMPFVTTPFRRAAHPLVAGLGYAALGGVAGGLSLWLLPALFIRSHALQVANALVTPLLCASVMSALGAWRRRHDRQTVLLDRFAYSFIFAFAMALLRLRFGQ